jgi:hypothetical protein
VARAVRPRRTCTIVFQTARGLRGIALDERAKEEKETYREIETGHPGYLGAQDTLLCREHQRREAYIPTDFFGAYTKTAFCKLYNCKNALAAADTLNNKVIPFSDSQGIPLLHVLTGQGSEYCGNRERHEYVLYLDIENIGHTKTKAGPPQNKQHLRKVQLGLDERVRQYNHEQTHNSKYCYGKTLVQAFINSIPSAKEKLLGCDVSDGQSA